MAREVIAVSNAEMQVTLAMASVAKLVEHKIVARDSQIRRRFSALVQVTSRYKRIRRRDEDCEYMRRQASVPETFRWQNKPKTRSAESGSEASSLRYVRKPQENVRWVSRVPETSRVWEERG